MENEQTTPQDDSTVQDDTNPVEGEETSQEAPQEPTEGEQPTEDHDTEPEPDAEQEDEKTTAELKKARKEAANYRSRLRDTETQLEAAEQGLDMARRQVLWDQHHGALNGYQLGGQKHSIVPSALNDVLGEDVSQFFDKTTGGLDQQAYKQHLQAMLDTKPHLFQSAHYLTQHELDTDVRNMIDEAGRSSDQFQNAVMGRQTY